MKRYLEKIGKNAQKAIVNKVNSKIKNKVLNKFSDLIKKNQLKIIKENLKDINNAKKKGMKENLISRLKLDKVKIKQIISSIETISKLKDPVNLTLKKWRRPNGLKIKKITIPIGVIGIIYESRPNVTADVSSLCFKSGNCIILKGGSEARLSNKILANLFRKALQSQKIDKNFVQFVDIKDRKIVNLILSKMKKYIDVIIPRGGKNLVKKVQNLSTVPIIGHLEGICHTYVDKEADLNMSKKIIYNAKMRNTSICGATETILIHEKCLKKFINPILKKLTDKNCIIYADKKVKKYFFGKSNLVNSNNWSREYLSKKVSVKCVKNVQEAINHINKFGTMHTDAIISKNIKTAKYFLKNVKSSIAIHNSSTQFADGGEFGFGGEVGISTNKLPPRGPVGLDQLVSYKYEVLGTGQIRK